MFLGYLTFLLPSLALLANTPYLTYFQIDHQGHPTAYHNWVGGRASKASKIDTYQLDIHM